MTTPVTAPARRGGRTQQARPAAKTTPAKAPAPRAGGRTQQGTPVVVRQRQKAASVRAAGGRTGGRTQQGTQGGARVRPGPVGPQRGFQGRAGGRQRQPRQPRITIDTSGGTSYQAVVLAEFVAAILLVAATPFAKKESPGISPYVGSDLLQLVAITLVYFVLALISGTNRGAGRFAAWFGALILLTVGLAEAARLAKLLNVFGLQSSPEQAASHGLGNQSGGLA